MFDFGFYEMLICFRLKKNYIINVFFFLFEEYVVRNFFVIKFSI